METRRRGRNSEEVILTPLERQVLEPDPRHMLAEPASMPLNAHPISDGGHGHLHLPGHALASCRAHLLVAASLYQAQPESALVVFGHVGPVVGVPLAAYEGQLPPPRVAKSETVAWRSDPALGFLSTWLWHP